MSYVTTTINITREMKAYAKEHCLNLSEKVRRLLSIEMEQSKETLNGASMKEVNR